MRRGSGVRIARGLLVWWVCGVVGFLGSPVVVFGEGVSSVLGSGSSSSLAGSPLVVPEVQSLDEGQQVGDAEEVRLSNPEAVAEREASRTRFEGLSGAQAVELVSKVFPAVVGRSDGG